MALIVRWRIQGEPMIGAYMQRRNFIVKTAATAGWILAGCASTGPAVTESDADKKRRQIDTNFFAALERLFTTVPGSRELVAKSRGVLGFPTVIPAAPGSGEQYGEGVLRVANAMEEYYSMTSVSAGSQTDTQSKTIIYLFMAQDALDKFRDSNGASVGKDTPVAILKTGARDSIDSRATTPPILAIGLGQSGLMANLNLKATKIIPLEL